VRPTCARCESRNTSCTYDVAAGTTRQVAIKRKASSLEEENHQLHTLFAYIRTRPPDDVAEIVKRIRNSSDLIEVLRFAQDGDLSLQQRLQRKLPDPRTIRIEADSLQGTGLRLPARPWTAVAGDGIVSDLVSRFFDIDQPFYCAMVDHSAFVFDMRASDTAVARYCSPMLVNAICALGAVSNLVRSTSARWTRLTEHTSSPRHMRVQSTSPVKGSFRNSSSMKPGDIWTGKKAKLPSQPCKHFV
jgi:hypothetical protein